MRSGLLVVMVAATVLGASPRGESSEMTLYEYDDGSGLQQVERLEDVPKKFRSKAKRVTSTLLEGAAASPKSTPAMTVDAGAATRPTGIVPGQRVYCTWVGKLRENHDTRACSRDGDCAPDVCVQGLCYALSTRKPKLFTDGSGKQWEGCFSDFLDLRSAGEECARRAAAKSGEEVICTCGGDPLSVPIECRQELLPKLPRTPEPPPAWR